MKIKYILPLLALMLGSVTFMSCGDDDVEAEPALSAEQVALNRQAVGSFSGWTHLKTNFINKNYDGDTFEFALGEDGKLIATFSNRTWGTATIKGIMVSTENNNQDYLLVGGEGQFVMNNPRDLENPTQTFSCALQSGTLSADRTELTVVLVAKMDVEGGHGDMTFTFTSGDMPTE